MSPSEIGFLALGLAFGITVGAVLLAVVRPRSPFRPVVKVTVTPHAMAPREAPTAAVRRAHASDVAPGSPDEDAHLGLPVFGPPPVNPASPVAPLGAPETRTRVPSAPASMPERTVAVPISTGGPSTSEAVAPRAPVDRDPVPAGSSGPVASSRPTVAVAERPSPRPQASALAERPSPRVDAASGRPEPLPAQDARARLALPTRVDVGHSRPGLAVRARPPVLEPRPSLSPNVVAIPIVAARTPRGASRTGAEAGSMPAAVDACATERAQSAAACAAADVARDAARSLADRLRDAQRAHFDLQARVEEAGALADPRRLAAEKERLHAQFTSRHGGVVSAEDAETAAREWLTAVSAANSAAQDAARRIQAGTDELRRQAVDLERLDLEAHAARITAERSESTCRAARESLAACEERQRPVSPPPDPAASERDSHWPGGPQPDYDPSPDAVRSAGPTPVILLVLRGDAGAREQLVARLADDDASAMAAWHVRIAKFVDAVTARAIEDGYLDTDDDHAFWRLFGGQEQQEIVRALASLGFRFDGMRGFVDDRVPSARDLSLAVGYAGIDRMRVRTWPGEAALAELFEGAIVRADVWLATRADDLSLERLEGALGPRAASLAELWDAWGRARPAMLEER